MLVAFASTLTKGERKSAFLKLVRIIRVTLYTIFVQNQDKSGETMKRIVENDKANIIGERIREERLRVGLSQQELSDRLELLAVYVCRGSISRIETGERAITDIEIQAIASVLKVPIQTLFEQPKE